MFFRQLGSKAGPGEVTPVFLEVFCVKFRGSGGKKKGNKVFPRELRFVPLSVLWRFF